MALKGASSGLFNFKTSGGDLIPGMRLPDDDSHGPKVLALYPLKLFGQTMQAVYASASINLIFASFLAVIGIVALRKPQIQVRPSRHSTSRD